MRSCRERCRSAQPAVLLTLLISPARPPADKPVAVWKCQAAIAATQASFVVGSVYLKGSLKYVDEAKGEAFSPIVYALAREAAAGPILLLLSWFIAGAGRRSDFPPLRAAVQAAAAAGAVQRCLAAAGAGAAASPAALQLATAQKLITAP